MQLLVIRTAMVFKYALIFMYETFNLSNCLWSLKEATSLDQEIGEVAKNRAIFNAWKILDRMSKTPEESKIKLEDQKAQIKGLLHSLKSSLVPEVDDSVLIIERLLLQAKPAVTVINNPLVKETYTFFKEQAREMLARLSFAVFNNAPKSLLESSANESTGPTFVEAISLSKFRKVLPISAKQLEELPGTIVDIQKKARQEVLLRQQVKGSIEGRKAIMIAT